MSNQRQIATTIQIYAQDHEETLPSFSTVWSDLNIEPGLLICPTLGKNTPNGYLYNASLSASAIGAIIDPSGPSSWMTTDGLNNSPDARHSNKLIASYVDGHVAAGTPITVTDPTFTDKFSGPDQTLVNYNAKYLVDANSTAAIVSGKLRLTDPINGSWSQKGVKGLTGLNTTLGGSSFGPGSFIACRSKLVSGSANAHGFVNLGGNLGYNGNNSTRSGYWSGSWIMGGSSQVTYNTDRHVGVVYASSFTHEFLDGQFNTTFPISASGTDAFRLTLQTGSTSDYAEYDNMVIGRNPYNSVGGATTMKAKLKLAYSDNFNRADSTTIGTGWTTNPGTIWTIDISSNQMRIKGTTAPNWSEGSATLDITNPAVLGRALKVGEYFEVDMKSTQGVNNSSMCASFSTSGFSTARVLIPTLTAATISTYIDSFGSDQGSSWNTMVPGTFNLSTGFRFGERLDYADGTFAITSFYINDNYVGSWLHNTTATTVDKIYCGCNTNISGDNFLYDNLSIYTKYQEEVKIQQ